MSRSPASRMRFPSTDARDPGTRVACSRPARRFVRRPGVAAGLLLASLSAVAAGCAGSAGLRPHARPAAAGDLAASRTLQDVRLQEAHWPDTEWWRHYGDVQLDALEAEALAGAPLLGIARARLRAARAASNAVRARLVPRVDGVLQHTRQSYGRNDVVPPPIAGSWHSANALVLDLDYDFDFAGGNRAAFAAATSAAQARRVDAMAARLLLTVAVARSYVQLARLYDQLAIARAELTRRGRTFDLTVRRVSAGIDDQVALQQARAAVPAAEGQLAALEQAVAVTGHQIAALLGQGPDRALSIRRPTLGAAADELALPSRLPADLLGRRPDVVAQRWRVEAAARRIDAARARFYPDVDLRMFAGLRSLGLSRWLEAGSGVAGIGPAVHLPIFQGGRLRAGLDQADAAYDLAVEGYNQTLADALRDFADLLASFHALTVRIDRQRAALQAVSVAHELALERYRGGLGSYLEVLSAREQLLTEERLQADLMAQARLDRVELVRALGGGLTLPTLQRPAVDETPLNSNDGKAS